MIAPLAVLAGGCAATAALCGLSALSGAPPARRKTRPPGLIASLPATLRRAASSRARRRRLAVTTGVGLLVLLVSGWPVAALTAATASHLLPRMLSGRDEHRQIAQLQALEEWARRMAEMLGASRGLEQALIDSVHIAPNPIRRPVGNLADQLRNHGSPDTALRAFATDLDDPVADLIATALILASARRGPGLRDALRSLADAIALQTVVRREVDAERASLRTTLIVIVISIGALTVVCLASPSYSSPYSSPLGQAVLALVAAIYAAGLGWLKHLATIHTGSRLLATQAPAAAAKPRDEVRAW